MAYIEQEDQALFEEADFIEAHYTLMITHSSVDGLLTDFTELHPKNEPIYHSGTSHIDLLDIPDFGPAAAKTELPTLLHDEPEGVHRIDQEYDLLSALSGHGSFVKPYGIGQLVIPSVDGHTNALIMEYVQGNTFETEMMHHLYGPDGMLWFNFFSSRLCSAIDYQHEQHIINTDLDFRNVIINQDGKMTIVDYGIGQQLSNRDDVVLLRGLGSERVAPNEQRKKICSVKTDIYAVGIYHLAWLLGSTNTDTILNTMNDVNNGHTTIKYGRHLSGVVPKDTVDALWEGTLPLLSKDPDARPDKLYSFRQLFARTLPSLYGAIH